MHVDAVAQDSATEMMLSKVLPQHLVVGLLVEGLFIAFLGKLKPFVLGRQGASKL